jgi:hypothetical protein
MTLETSKEYKAEVKARRLFGSIHEQLSALGTQVEALLALGNTMRNMVGQAALSLAQIEALYVDQTHDKRNVDALLFTAQTQLADLAAKTGSRIGEASNVIAANAKGIASMSVQANRTVGDRYVRDAEPGAPVPGVDYVDMAYIGNQLGITPTHVRRLIENGKIPAHDAVTSEDSGRPKFLFRRTMNKVV